MKKNKNLNRNGVNRMKNNFNLTDYRFELEGISKMGIYRNGNDKVDEVLYVLGKEMREKGLKSIGYSAGQLYSSYVSVFIVPKDYIRPRKSTDIDTDDCVSWYKFYDSNVKTLKSEQGKMLIHFLNKVKTAK